ncbi:hypothetical protein ACVWZD_000675 [Streptomyces sp. TE3672]
MRPTPARRCVHGKGWEADATVDGLAAIARTW